MEQRILAADSAQVEDLLGLRSSRGSSLALADSVEEGLPVSALDRLASTISPGDAQFKYRLIPQATLQRRRKSAKKVLNCEESNRLARLAKVFAFAQNLYGSASRAREFLTRPHMMLDNRVPLDVALATGPGADVVLNLLGRASHGSAV